MRIMLTLTFLAAFLAAPALADDAVTQADLIRRLIDLDGLTAPPAAGVRAGLASSYDRRQSIIKDGRYVDWAANKDRGQFEQVAEDGWNVMAIINSPGAITRIWCENPEGLIRIVLDGVQVVEAPLGDVFNGALAPFGMPLSYELPSKPAGVSYFPIGFGESCLVLSRGFNGEYQIDYLTYPTGTRVQRFTADLDREAEETLNQVADIFRRGLNEDQLYWPYSASPYAIQQDLKGGDVLSMDLTGERTIRGLHVSITDQFEPRDKHALHNVILRIFWDGRDKPGIEAPLTEFFGAGFTRNRYQGLVMGTDLSTNMPGEYANEGWFMYCYYPMPFKNGARVEIENLNPKASRKIGVMLYMRASKGMPFPDALRFKARMRTENPCKTFDFPILETAGAGRLVGCVVNVDCPREQWWGEGDHKIWLDDEAFPSILGTSTSGFLGAASGLCSFRMPLHGVTLTNPVGKNSAYRWMISDNVPFHKSIRFVLENWQIDRADDVYYNTMVYWYGAPGAAESFDSISQESLKLSGLRIPGAVEIEGHVVGEKWGRVKTEKYADGVEFSSKTAAFITTREPVGVVIPSDEAGKYNLSLRVQTGRSFGEVSVTDSSGSIIGTIEYDYDAKDGVYLIGEINLKKGDNPVVVQCSRSTVLDCWILEKLD